MKNINIVTFLAALLAICFVIAPVPAFAQATTTATTLSVATNSTITSVTVASATNFVANGAIYTEDGEVMIVNSSYTSGTRIPVQRGASGTVAMAHPASVRVWFFTPGQQMRAGLRSGSLPGSNPQGACTSTNEIVLPIFNTSTNTMFTCTGSKWVRTGLSGGTYFCGATTGAATCSTATGITARTIGGVATLASNSAVITFTTGFTATTTYSCVANDVTTRANVVQMVPTSATSATITNTTGASDVVNWICSGY